MRVLVTGSRDWESEGTVWRELNAVALEASVSQVPLTVVHGDCSTGADRHARRWSERWQSYLIDSGLNFYEERHPADWRQGRYAGPYRNRQMVDLGADLCLAFIRPCVKPSCRLHHPHDSHGAADTVDRAVEAGIEIKVFREGF